MVPNYTRVPMATLIRHTFKCRVALLAARWCGGSLLRRVESRCTGRWNQAYVRHSTSRKFSSSPSLKIRNTNLQPAEQGHSSTLVHKRIRELSNQGDVAQLLEILKTTGIPNYVTGRYLFNACMRANDLHKAELALRRMTSLADANRDGLQHDLSRLIIAIINSKQHKEALRVFHYFRPLNIKYEAMVYNRLLYCCGIIQDKSSAEQILAEMKRNNIAPSPFFYSSLIELYAGLRDHEKLRSTIEEAKAHNAYSLDAASDPHLDKIEQNSLREGIISLAARTALAMVQIDSSPTSKLHLTITPGFCDFVAYLRASTTPGSISAAEIFAGIANICSRDRYIAAALYAFDVITVHCDPSHVTMVSFVGFFEAASKVAEQTDNSDVRAACGEHVRKVLQILRKYIAHPDVVAYTAALTALSRCGNVDESQRLFSEMVAASTRPGPAPVVPTPTAVTASAMATALASVHNHTGVVEMWHKLLENPTLKPLTRHPYVIASSALSLALAGRIQWARKAFEEALLSVDTPPDVAAWTAMIAAESHAGHMAAVNFLLNVLIRPHIEEDMFDTRQPIGIEHATIHSTPALYVLPPNLVPPRPTTRTICVAVLALVQRTKHWQKEALRYLKYITKFLPEHPTRADLDPVVYAYNSTVMKLLTVCDDKENLRLALEVFEEMRALHIPRETGAFRRVVRALADQNRPAEAWAYLCEFEQVHGRLGDTLPQRIDVNAQRVVMYRAVMYSAKRMRIYKLFDEIVQRLRAMHGDKLFTELHSADLLESMVMRALEKGTFEEAIALYKEARAQKIVPRYYLVSVMFKEFCERNMWEEAYDLLNDDLQNKHKEQPLLQQLLKMASTPEQRARVAKLLKQNHKE